MSNPIAHTRDPAPSHEAAGRVSKSGQRDRHAEAVHFLVRCHPGLTAIELWEKCDPVTRAALKEAQEVRRRLTDLVAAGKVWQGKERTCSVRHTKMVVWWPWAPKQTLFD